MIEGFDAPLPPGRAGVAEKPSLTEHSMVAASLLRVNSENGELVTSTPFIRWRASRNAIGKRRALIARSVVGLG